MQAQHCQFRKLSLQGTCSARECLFYVHLCPASNPTFWHSVQMSCNLYLYDAVNTQSKRTHASRGKPRTFYSIFKYMHGHIKGSFKWFELSGTQTKKIHLMNYNDPTTIYSTLFLGFALESLLSCVQIISFYLSVVLLHQQLAQKRRSCPWCRVLLCSASPLTRPTRRASAFCQCHQFHHPTTFPK